MRQLAHIVDAIICYIGFLFPLWDDKRQTLADKIMTTVCVPLTRSLATVRARTAAVLNQARADSTEITVLSARSFAHRKALTPVSASPMTSWCTSDVPS